MLVSVVSAGAGSAWRCSAAAEIVSWASGSHTASDQARHSGSSVVVWRRPPVRVLPSVYRRSPCARDPPDLGRPPAGFPSVRASSVALCWRASHPAILWRPYSALPELTCPFPNQDLAKRASLSRSAALLAVFHYSSWVNRVLIKVRRSLLLAFKIRIVRMGTVGGSRKSPACAPARSPSVQAHPATSRNAVATSTRSDSTPSRAWPTSSATTRSRGAVSDMQALRRTLIRLFTTCEESEMSLQPLACKFHAA